MPPRIVSGRPIVDEDDVERINKSRRVPLNDDAIRNALLDGAQRAGASKTLTNDTSGSTAVGINFNEILRLQADETPKLYTIFLGPPSIKNTAANPLPVTTGADIKGRVTWGVGDVSVQMLVDFRNGCAFTVWASSIIVEAQFIDALFVNGTTSTVTVMVAEGDYSKGDVTFSVASSLLPAAGSASIVIPFFARAFSFVRLPATTGFTIKQLDVAGASLSEHPFGAGRDCNRLELIPKAKSVSITNDGAVNMTSLMSTFHLGGF